MKLFQFINTGSTRLVFLLGKFAVKIPRCFIKPDNTFYGKLLGFLQGWSANRTEYIWSKSKLYSYLNPVRLSLFGSMIIIMDRAEELPEEVFYTLDNTYEFGGFEWKVDSFGVVDGAIKIIDYGN